MAKKICFAFVCLMLLLLTLSCSSSKSSNNSGGNGPLQFTSPTTSPTIESFGPTPFVNLEVISQTNSAITWTLTNGSGYGKAQGSLTSNGTSATYTAPAPLPALTSGECNPFGSPPYPELQMAVTATDASGNSVTMPIFILQTPPCVATTASITGGICAAGATISPCPPYPTLGPTNCTIGSSSCACPANGSLMVPQVGNNGLEPQPFEVGVYGALQIYEGGGNNGVPFGQPPFTWSVSSGTLPSGLTLQPGPTSTSIFLEGTPVASGCSNFTLQVTDSLGASGQLPYFAAIVPAGLKVSAPNSFNGVGGVAYPPTALVASGGVPPYSWIPNPFASLCSSGEPVGLYDLPPGLTLNTQQNSVAVISGVPADTDWNVNVGNCGSYTAAIQTADSEYPYPALGKAPISSISGFFPGNQPSFCTPQGTVVLTGGLTLPADAYLSGTYSFMLRGFDANGGPLVIAGSVQMDGQGNITSGVEDVTSSSGSKKLTLEASTYTVGPLANNGCMKLTDSTGAASTFGLALASCSNGFTTSTGEIQPTVIGCGINGSAGSTSAAGEYMIGRMIEFDSNGNHLSGILRMQNTSSFSGGLSGMYAFGLSGWDAATAHYAMAGSVQASGGAFSSAAADIDDAGTVSSTLTGGTGTFASVDGTYGRSTGTLTIGPASLDVAMYVVDSNYAIVITTDPLDSSHPVLSGEAVGTTGPFSFSTLQNSHMFHIGGVGSSGPDVSIGVLNFDGIGGITGKVYENQAGTLGTTSVSGIYSVDANTGRALFSATQVGQTLGNHAFIGYVVPQAAGLTRATCAKPWNCITGFLVGSDSTAQDGVMEFQNTITLPPTPPNLFYNAFVLGDFAFGAQEILGTQSTSSEGYFEASPTTTASNNTGTLSRGARDTSFGDCWQGVCRSMIPAEQLISGAYTINTDGTGTFGGETVSITNGRTIFYLDESPLNLNPTVSVAEQ